MGWEQKFSNFVGASVLFSESESLLLEKVRDLYDGRRLRAADFGLGRDGDETGMLGIVLVSTERKERLLAQKLSRKQGSGDRETQSWADHETFQGTDGGY